MYSRFSVMIRKPAAFEDAPMAEEVDLAPERIFAELLLELIDHRHLQGKAACSKEKGVTANQTRKCVCPLNIFIQSRVHHLYHAKYKFYGVFLGGLLGHD